MPPLTTYSLSSSGMQAETDLPHIRHALQKESALRTLAWGICTSCMRWSWPLLQTYQHTLVASNDEACCHRMWRRPGEMAIGPYDRQRNASHPMGTCLELSEQGTQAASWGSISTICAASYGE